MKIINIVNLKKLVVVYCLTMFFTGCGGGSSSSNPTTINDDENKSPVALNDSVNVIENVTSTIDIIQNDYDSDGSIDKSSIEIINTATQGTISVEVSTGKVSYTPNTGEIGNDSFTYTIKDNEESESNEATVTITLERDTDDDGIADSIDTDNDNDGISDEDEQANGTNPLSEDSDSDGVDDKTEGTIDSDTDGIIDALESAKGDTDSDGVSDQQDAENTNPENDSDNDGFSNADEKLNETDPLDDISIPRPFKFKIYSDTFSSGGLVIGLPPAGYYEREPEFTVRTNDEFDYKYSIDCNSDGVLEAEDQTGDYTCDYSTFDEFTISIFGKYPVPKFSEFENYSQLLSIEQWAVPKYAKARNR